MKPLLSIRSGQNPKIKLARRLLTERRARERENAFVVESGRWLGELVQRNISPHFVLVTNGFCRHSHYQTLLNQLSAPIYLVSDDLLQSVTDLESPAGILAVIQKPEIVTHSDETNPLILLLDGVTNPGNLGTMMRTATAAGVTTLLLAPGCVDPYNPKVVRAGMGAHLHLLPQLADWEEIRRVCAGIPLWLADSNGEKGYTVINWREPTGLIIGNEAHGAGAEAKSLAEGAVHIPMFADTESLNAAVSAGIILFEAVRQRLLG